MAAAPRESQLRKWINWLRARDMLRIEPTRAQVDEARASGIVWLEWPTLFSPFNPIHNADLDIPGHREYATIRYEAMELLALLAQINYSELITLLQQMWPEAIARWLGILDGKRIQLGIEVCTRKRGAFTEVCTRLLEQDVLFSATAGYARVRQELEDELRAKPRLPSLATGNTDVVVPVRLTIEATEGDGKTDYSFALWNEMRTLVNLQMAQQHATTVSTGQQVVWQQPIFRIVELKLDYATSSFCKQDLLHVHKITASGIRVSPICVGAVKMTKGVAPQLAPTLQQILTHATAISGPLRRDDDQTIDSIFSGLLATTSVRTLASIAPRADSATFDRQWQWIALTAFSRHAAVSIEKITLDCDDLSDQAITVIKEMVSASNPLTLLYPGCHGTAMATASKFCLTPPSTMANWDGPPPTWIESKTPVEKLLVLSGENGSDDHVSVLLPGWGQAWVDRRDITFTGPQGAISTRLQPSRHVVLTKLDVKQVPIVSAFLQIVGPVVRKICFDRQGQFHIHTLSSAVLTDTFRSCPHLQELEIKKLWLRSLEDIATQYETGLCQVKKLVLNLTWVDDRDTACQFFERLADSRHPMTQHLCVLHVKFQGTAQSLPRMESAVHRMLQQNRRLYEIRLNINHHANDDDDREDAFERYDGQLVIEPLPLAHKLAFLSVALLQDTHEDSKTSGRSSSSHKAIHSLDTSVLSTIFLFAAHSRPRWVQVIF